ncbi:MAG: hypothetical protein RLN76_06270 [Phycisphaeraceae bacterium]
MATSLGSYMGKLLVSCVLCAYLAWVIYVVILMGYMFITWIFASPYCPIFISSMACSIICGWWAHSDCEFFDVDKAPKPLAISFYVLFGGVFILSCAMPAMFAIALADFFISSFEAWLTGTPDPSLFGVFNDWYGAKKTLGGE